MSDSPEELADTFFDWVEECWPVTSKRLPTPVLYRRLKGDFENAILQSRSQAFEEAAQIAEEVGIPKATHCPKLRVEMIPVEISQAIRQHSQKGEE